VHHLLSQRSREQRGSRIRELLKLTERPDMLSLAGGLPAADRFPSEIITDAFERAMLHRGPTGPQALQYAPTEGVGMLRERLAAEADCSVDSTLITTGSQQGLDLLARVLCDPGDVVITEDPSYLGALQAFRFAGARVVGVPGDSDGLDTEALATLLAGGARPKFVYVCSNFGNPTGATLSSARRRHVLDLAERYGFLVVEDDPYGALRFAGQAPQSMFAPGRPVVRLRSASKVLAPGLRVGWMTGPATIVTAAGLAKQATDLHTSSLNQLIVMEAFADPRFADHVTSNAAVYAERAGALSAALRRSFGDRVEFTEPQGGMFIWARLLSIDTSALLESALDGGVAFVPGSAFAVEDESDHTDRLRLSFATLTPTLLQAAAERLARAAAVTLV